ncbi:MAG: hypothetical protein K2K79_08130 [Paramuribaculum sp.]|nr:hypothetical protein [Paramuribaculum sp.]
MPDWIQKILDVIKSIGDFFVLMWNDENRWWCIGGLLVAVIMIYKMIISPLILLFGGRNGYSISNTHSEKKPKASNKKSVIIKGVYQMNGPKPFKREITCSSSEVGSYSQLMGNKRKQAQWIKTNFPGADTSRDFSVTVNIK